MRTAWAPWTRWEGTQTLLERLLAPSMLLLALPMLMDSPSFPSQTVSELLKSLEDSSSLTSLFCSRMLAALMRQQKKLLLKVRYWLMAPRCHLSSIETQCRR